MGPWMALAPWAVAAACWVIWPPYIRRWLARVDDPLARMLDEVGEGDRTFAEALFMAAFWLYHMPLLPLVLTVPVSVRERHPVATGRVTAVAGAVAYSGIAWWAWSR